MISFFWKGTVIVLLTVILGLCLSKEGLVTKTLLLLAVSSMVCLTAIGFLEPVISFLRQVQDIADLDTSLFGIMLKVTGIALVGQIATLICTDAGMVSLGKVLELLTTAVIVWCSLPMLEGLLELIRKIMGEI